MKNLPVHWSEGMFLRPHHFQAADRYWTEQLDVSEAWDHPYNYGIRALELSPAAIENYQVEVTTCQARLRDGTLISIEANQGLDRVDLRKAFETRGSVKVFLAVPRLKIGTTNVAPSAQGGRSRYLARAQAMQDESFGGNDQELGFRAINVRLMLEGDETEGYELLPIAQIERAGEQQAFPQIDKNYFPPMLSVEAWHPLGLEIVRYLYDKIGKRIERLAGQVTNRSITFANQDPVDLARLFMLVELNSAYATLGTLAFCDGLHPFAAYTELCRIVGQLSIFNEKERRTPLDIPRYDHDDLARIFNYVKNKIELLMEEIPDDKYEQRFFEGWGRGMRCKLNPKWLGTDWQWFVGVTYSGNMKETDCRKMLSPGYLNWKLGSERQVDDLYEFGLEGLHLVPQERTPRPLPERNWIYYQVTRDNNAFRDVLDHESLAMRLNENLILNFDTLKGQQKIRIRFENGQAELQFALFAVPSSNVLK
jgi:type VI secretion system protein ImpJ